MGLLDQDVIVQAIELIENRIGLAIRKQYHHEFPDLFRRLAQGNPKTYLQQLQHTTMESTEWQRLIHTLTIGETYFLREENHFKVLQKHILPKHVLQRRQAQTHRLRIWSAGCASGEEPYSIAIILHQFLPDIAKWDIEIYGTDINKYSLQTAQQGIYRQWAFRDTDAMFQQNYFNKVEGGFQIKPVIQKMVTFRQHNLLHDNPLGKFDIIFCKNVLLYFDETVVKAVEDHLFMSLNPQGWLFLGQAEALRSRRERWQTHIFPGSPIYQHTNGTASGLDYPPIRVEADDTQSDLFTDETKDYYALAVDAVHEENHSLAEQHLSLALSHKQNLPKSHTLLAWIFANRKAFPEAEAHLTATLAVSPLHANAHYVSALIALEQDRLDDATKALHMTLYCDPYHMLAIFMLGNLYAKIGDLPKAHSQWYKIRQAIETCHPTEYVSDLGDLTIGQLDALITHLSDV